MRLGLKVLRLRMNAMSPQAMMALTIDRLVPSKNTLTRTIMVAPVLSCRVPMRAEAVPAMGP
jgi:hypothetical protein